MNDQLIIFIQIMKVCIFVATIFLLLSVSIEAAEQTTTLSYIAEFEDEQEDDYIEISLEIQAQEIELSKAIGEAKATVSDVEKRANQFCRKSKKGKIDCKEAIDVGKFQIKPNYQKIRKEDQLKDFVVNYEVTIKVLNTDKVGELVDGLLDLKDDLTLKSFQWKPFDEKSAEEGAIKAGKEQAEQLCSEMGLSFKRIVSVEEIVEEQKEQKKSQDEDQEEEEEPEISKYKFEVECDPKGKSKK